MGEGVGRTVEETVGGTSRDDKSNTSLSCIG